MNFPQITIKTFVNRSHFSQSPEIVVLYEYPNIIKHKEVIKTEGKFFANNKEEAIHILQTFKNAVVNILEKLNES